MKHNGKTLDVIIIGGSAAGLFAAYELAREGVKVCVFDAGDPLQTSHRALITTSRLTEVLGFCPSNAIVNQINEIDLFSRDGSATIRMKKPDLVVERAKIIELLAQRATGAGAEIRSRCKFANMAHDADGLKIIIRDIDRGRVEEIATTTIIGADGAFSSVAKVAQRNGKQTVPVLQAIVPMPRDARPHAAQVWFDPEATPYFYWVIPESEGRAAVGLIGEDGRSTKLALEQFLCQKGFDPIEIQAARIPLYAWTSRPWRRISNCDVYLIGDAAGQVKVTTVGGLVTGLCGAKASAQAILHRADYWNELKPLRRELTLHLGLRSILDRFSTADYNRLLQMLDKRVSGVLSFYSRDELAKFFLRLIVAQPRFLLFGARLFLPQSVKKWLKKFR